MTIDRQLVDNFNNIRSNADSYKEAGISCNDITTDNIAKKFFKNLSSDTIKVESNVDGKQYLISVDKHKLNKFLQSNNITPENKNTSNMIEAALKFIAAKEDTGFSLPAQENSHVELHGATFTDRLRDLQDRFPEALANVKTKEQAQKMLGKIMGDGAKLKKI